VTSARATGWQAALSSRPRLLQRTPGYAPQGIAPAQFGERPPGPFPCFYTPACTCGNVSPNRDLHRSSTGKPNGIRGFQHDVNALRRMTLSVLALAGATWAVAGTPPRDGGGGPGASKVYIVQLKAPAAVAYHAAGARVSAGAAKLSGGTMTAPGFDKHA